MMMPYDDAGTSGVQRFEVFTGVGKRRDWPPEVKVSIVAESYAGTETVCAVARRHGLSPSQLFTWRRELRKQMEAQGLALPMSLLRRNAPSDRRGCVRAARRRADHLPRARHPPATLRMSRVRECGRAGSRTVTDRRGRHFDRGADRPGAGVQVRRSPATVSASPDLSPAGHSARPIHAGRLGRASGLVSSPLARACARTAATINQALRRRDHRAATRSGARADQDRPDLGLRSG